MGARRTIPPSWQLRVSDDLPATADLVIVGAGIVGCATAFFATAGGLDVVVLDARARPATLTTPVSTGAFRLQFDNPEEIALVREGVELFPAFGDQTGLAGYDIGLRRNGYLFCALTPETLGRQERMVALQQQAGVPDIELISGDEARYRFPYLSPDVLQARFRAGDGFLDPVRVAFGFALASSNGPGVERAAGTGAATFSLGSRVTGIVRSGHAVTGVKTPRGTISTRQVVLATGPFLGTTAALADVMLDIRPTRRQKLLVADIPEVPPDAPMTIEEETAAHWRPALRGAYLLFTDPEVKPGAPEWDVRPSADFAFRLLDPASPTAVAKVTPFWRRVWDRGPSWVLHAGQYEYTPDRRPFIGPTGVEGLFVNGGYSGHGIMGSTGGSRLLVDLLVGRSTGPEWAIRPRTAAANPFRIDRPMPEREFDIL